PAKTHSSSSPARIALCDSDGSTSVSLDIAAASELVGTARRDRLFGVGLAGASGSQDGPSPVLNFDGEPRVPLGRNVRSAWPGRLSRDSIRLPVRFGGQHLHVRADVPLSVIPTQPAVDEPGVPVRLASEPGRL